MDPQSGLFFFLEVLEREKKKKGQKLILEMLEPIKKQQNEMQNCVLSDFGNDSF